MCGLACRGEVNKLVLVINARLARAEAGLYNCVCKEKELYMAIQDYWYKIILIVLFDKEMVNFEF